MREWPAFPVHRFDRAVFLDRDGTINVDTHYPHRPAELELITGAVEGLKLLSDLQVHIIVISNQAGIALGRFSERDMREFNQAIRQKVADAGARIDAFYYSPDLEPKHLQPDDTPSSQSKPAPGMLFEAANDFDVDLKRSFVVGDTTSDIAAGQAVGCTTILLMTGKAGMEEGALPVKPDRNAGNLYIASQIVSRELESEPA